MKVNLMRRLKNLVGSISSGIPDLGESHREHLLKKFSKYCRKEIWKYISKDSTLYATLFVKRVNIIVKSIPQFPKFGRIVPEYGSKNLREKIYENYRIVYRIKEDIIEIVTICHGSKPSSNIL